MDDKNRVAPQEGVSSENFGVGAGSGHASEGGMLDKWMNAESAGVQEGNAGAQNGNLDAGTASTEVAAGTDTASVENAEPAPALGATETAAPVNPENPFVKNSSGDINAATQNAPATENPPAAQGVPSVGDAPAAANVPNAPVAPSMTGAPAAQPMPNGAEKKPKNKKAGIIAGVIGGILALGVAVAVGVVVAIKLNEDPVAVAVDKIMSKGLPQYAKVDGRINITPAPNDSDSTLNAACDVTLNADVETATFQNNLTANMDCSSDGTHLLTISAEERYANDGKVYLKVDGLNDLMSLAMGAEASTEEDEDEMGSLYESEDEEEEDGLMGGGLSTNDNSASNGNSTLGSNSLLGGSSVLGGSSLSDSDSSMVMGLMMLGMFSNMFDAIDGEWIAIDTSDASSSSSVSTTSSCETTLIDDLRGAQGKVAELYRANPFISSTSEKVPVESLSGKIYKIEIDNQKYASFLSSLENSALLTNYTTCLQDKGEKNALSELPQNLPTIYAEVDGNHDFSRLYWLTSFDERTDYTFDLRLSYPTSIQVTTPEDATDLQELLESAFSSSFSGYSSSYDDSEDYDYYGSDDEYDTSPLLRNTAD